MNLFNNPFVRACTSGFGTGTSAGKALGYSVLIVSFLIIFAVYAGIWAYKLIKKFSGNKKTDPDAEVNNAQAQQ